MSSTKGRLIRQEEAVLLLNAVADEKTKSIVGAFFAALWQETQEGVAPACDFDLEFFVRIVIRCGGKHELIKSIIDGGDFGSWPD